MKGFTFTFNLALPKRIPSKVGQGTTIIQDRRTKRQRTRAAQRQQWRKEM